MQTSVMSPRMKLAVSHHQMKQDRPNTKISTSSPELNNSSSAAQNGQIEASKGDGSMQQRKEADSAAASVHPVRGDEHGYDSSSSFEFHSRERSQYPCRRSYLPSSRTIMPSKWDDAEKWIINKQNVQLIRVSNKTNTQNRVVGAAPLKRADLSRPETGPGKFEFGSFRAEPIALVEAAGAGIPGRRSAAMRDMGTEMTPVPSQEPSRSPTPVGATTPLRSPASTPLSSPQRQTHQLPTTKAEPGSGEDGERESLSEQEMKCKITREIVALGVHLGKMNIVAWACKDERERNRALDADEGRRIEYRNRAAAWEEAEKSKHEARFKREEIRIQALERRQKAMSEEKTRRLEVRIEQMRARAQAKMEKKMALARRKTEEKRAAAEARKARLHKKSAQQAKYICQTGRIPSTFFTCCWWSRPSYN